MVVHRAYNTGGLVSNSCTFCFSFHLCCTLIHTQSGVADAFISDVRECTAAIMMDPREKASGMVSLYNMSQHNRILVIINIFTNKALWPLEGKFLYICKL